MSRTIASLSRLAVLFLVCFFSITASAQAPPAAKIIAHFAGTNGANPASQLIQLPSGNLLGLTLTAPYYPKIPSTIYQILHTGAIQTVYTLAADGSEGAINGGQFTNNGLVQASDGNIYGLTYSGKREAGAGLVFRVTFPNTFEVLHQFTFDSTDCAGAVGSLVEASDGNLYGLASEGGASGYGAIFRVGLDGKYSKIYDFSADVVGGYPFHGFVAHPNGFLYGATNQSLNQGIYGNGSLFEFDPQSGTVSLIAPSPFGVGFLSAPMIGLDGGVYVVDAPPPSCGSCTGELVRYGTDGTGPETLFTFPVGVFPGYGLIETSAGVFLNASYPALLIDTKANVLTQIPISTHIYSGVLENFTETIGGEAFGAYPQTTPLPFFGAIVEISGGFQKPLPTIRGVFPTTVAPGGSVTVLGDQFPGATAVVLGSNPVTFSVKASGAITFIAPAAMESGTVSVTTPGGVATSQGIVTVSK